MRTYRIIKCNCETPNLYLVTSKSGVVRRNRWHLVSASFKVKVDISSDFLSKIPLAEMPNVSVNVNPNDPN